MCLLLPVLPAAALALDPEVPSRLALQLRRPLPEGTGLGHLLVAMQMDGEVQTANPVIPEQGPVLPVPFPGGIVQMH